MCCSLSKSERFKCDWSRESKPNFGPNDPL